MQKKRTGRYRCLLLGMILWGLTACSAQEWLAQTPETLQADSQTAKESEEAYSFLNPEASTYAYDTLSEELQVWYREIEKALGSMEGEIWLSTEGLKKGLNEESVDLVFQCVLNDHPEIFYVDGYLYSKYSKGDELIALSFSGNYGVDKETAISKRQEIEQAAMQLVSRLDEEATEYDKVKYVYETLIRNTDYEHDVPDNQNIYSVLVNHKSVCQGYAKATQYLLNKLGVECTLIRGRVKEEGHAWNLMRVEGDWYYTDTTWGDASYRANREAAADSPIPEINYDYLCITTQQLLRTHTLDSCVPVPECDALSANYYAREGTLLYDYDEEQLERIFHKMIEQRQQALSVRCVDEACYDKVRLNLISNQKIFDFIPKDYGNVCCTYSINQLSLSFWVTNP